MVDHGIAAGPVWARVAGAAHDIGGGDFVRCVRRVPRLVRALCEGLLSRCGARSDMPNGRTPLMARNNLKLRLTP
jgi:hypothetical protein